MGRVVIELLGALVGIQVWGSVSFLIIRLDSLGLLQISALFPQQITDWMELVSS